MRKQTYVCTFKLHFTRSRPKPTLIINTTPYLWVIENSIHIIKSYILIWLKVRWFVTFLEPIIFQNLWNCYSLKGTKKAYQYFHIVFGKDKETRKIVNGWKTKRKWTDQQWKLEKHGKWLAWNKVCGGFTCSVYDTSA